MTREQFDKMVADMPHLTPVLTSVKYRLEERAWFDYKPSLFDIVRRDNYLKSNGKKCYVDTTIKQIEIDRSMIVVLPNTLKGACVKKRFVNKIINENGYYN